MFLWISSNSCPLTLLLVRSHQAERIIVKRLIQGRNNLTRVRVKLRSFDQGCHKNKAFTLSATLPTECLVTVTDKIFAKFRQSRKQYQQAKKTGLLVTA